MIFFKFISNGNGSYYNEVPIRSKERFLQNVLKPHHIKHLMRHKSSEKLLCDGFAKLKKKELAYGATNTFMIILSNVTINVFKHCSKFLHAILKHCILIYYQVIFHLLELLKLYDCLTR